MTDGISYLTSDAKTDLIEIRRYTLQHWGAHQSIKYLSELKNTLSLLINSPNLGKSRPEVGSKVFSFPYASHMIYYTINKQRPVIFAVLHKRMVPIKHLSERKI